MPSDPHLTPAQARLNGLYPVGAPFLQQVLGLDLAQVRLEEDSNLRDFSGVGMPADRLANCPDSFSLHNDWDAWLLEILERDYGVALRSTDIALVQLFEKLCSGSPPVLPQPLLHA